MHRSRELPTARQLADMLRVKGYDRPKFGEENESLIL